MTREEAIKCIEKYLCRINGTVSKQDFVKALEMATKALKVDLVRCWECDYHYYADNRVFDEQGHVCDYYHFETEPNGYCHVGIRRGSDE